MTDTKGRMPDFLIIGAARAGTSSLYEYMRQHPDIWFSPVKEPMFFSLEGTKPDFRGPGDDREINRKSVTDVAAYQALFAGAGSKKAVGEASANYLYSEEAAARIKHYIPDARMIAVLRNPVERAYSSFLYMIRDRREQLRDFSQALEQENARIAGHWEHIWHYAHMGYYGQQLQRYYALFGKNRIRVYLNEEMKQDAPGLLKNVFSFIGVDDTFLPDTSITYNEGGVPKRKLLNAVLTRPGLVKRLLRPIMPAAAMKFYTRLKHDNLEKPPLDDEVRARLVALYRDDVLRLQDMTGKDLSAWLRT
jgi:hypothetical protein